MKEFFLEEFKNRETYIEFIKYMLSHSDAFSLVYFKYRENDRMKKKTKTIYENLKRFKICSKKTQEWPNTVTFDEEHIYTIIFYHADVECLDTLTMVDDIYDWYYAKAPIDLCFYKDGYCWLAVTAHEHMASLYTDNKEEVEELRDLGADLEFCGETVDLFYCDLNSN